MPDVVIKVRENGPLLVTGPITLTDHLGNKFDLSGKENVALCRCGASRNRPFCDGSHRDCKVLEPKHPDSGQGSN